MTREDTFDGLFAPEPEDQQVSEDRLSWKILLVDDEPDIHAALKLAIQSIVANGQPVEILEAESAAEAEAVLLRHEDIALVLLDVVMESNHAGLELVQRIRGELNNQSIQIILVTGQPGYAPQNEVISRYAINGYMLKSELTNEKIYAAIHTSVRTYQLARQLERSESRYRDLYDNSPDMYVSVDAETALIRECNQTVARKLGYTKSEIIGCPIFELYCPDSLEGAKQAFDSFVTTGSVNNAELQLQCRDGSFLDVNLNVSAVRDASGKVLHSRSCWIDVSARKKMENELRLAAKVFTHASEGITLTDADGTILDTNEAFSRITGYARNEVLGKNPRILKSGRHDKEFYQNMWTSLLSEGQWSGEIWNRRKNGEIYVEMLTINAVKNPDGRIQSYIALFSDITTQKEHQKRLEHIAHYDALTDLPNRVLLADRLEQAMVQQKRRKEFLAVIYLDLDGFKEVNDTHGHNVGDLLLVEVSKHLHQALRNCDTIARIGGDEFVVVLNDLAEKKDCFPILDRIVHAAASSVLIESHQLQVSASLGVTFYPQPESIDADQLLRQADQAMYQAKLTGKNRYQFFDTNQYRSMQDHHDSLQRIAQGLANREFVLHYQPKVNMLSGTMVGVEALLRWQHPERGLLPPLEFLPVIADHRLAAELDQWVIQTAVSQMAEWQDMGLNLPVSVNVGPLQLQQEDFVQQLEEVFADYPNLDRAGLELEILETSALKDVDLVSRIIRDCNKHGFAFALDDFGTGYSPLTYLKSLPVSTLKIDQLFVKSMLTNPDDQAIVEGVIGLARAFDRDLVAEGVETMEHARILVNMGCDKAQGYAFSRPVPAAEILRLQFEKQAFPEITL